jgi:hypothetical protein
MLSAKAVFYAEVLLQMCEPEEGLAQPGAAPSIEF